jgi:FlaA1/EpsC-like NDP-sugar epimerase
MIFAVDCFLLAGDGIPRVVLLLDWGVTVIALGGVRSAARIVREHPWAVKAAKRKRPVLVVGTEKGDEALVRQIHANPELDYRVIGFLDKDPAFYGSRISGIPFLGSPSDAVSISQRKQVSDIFVITGSLSGQHLRLLLAACHRASINVKMIPPIGKLLDGTYQLHVRDVDINDLLQRAPVLLDTEAIAKMIRGRRVMVTGAGGSIGSEICRQIIPHQPQKLILVERAENNLFHIQQELAGDAHEVICAACVADVCDEERLEVIFQRYEPDVVFHAAAHKHVPLMEINAGEAVKNNVFGTKNVVDLSHKYDVDRFILISTDKVVNPTSVMGLSKKLCERYVRSMAEESATKMVVVRFGNVLGSNGSVVPTFQNQIRSGGPVTVTHPEMQRFFMTIPEASQLVLQSAVLGHSGEIFVLDMGNPVKIVDLAKDLIRLSGFSEEEIDMTFVGVRPGEKLYEELYDMDERTAATSHPKLRVVIPQAVDQQKVLDGLDELEPLVNGPEAIIREKLLDLTDSGQQLVETVPVDLTE